MIAIISLLLVMAVSLIVTRVATISLMHTGMSKQIARFQARSAFTGAGFTTVESEKVLNHPVRRKIIGMLMLLGNAGLVTAVSTLILGFIGRSHQSSLLARAGVLAAGLAVLFFIVRSQWVDRHLSRIIDLALRRYTDLDVKDYGTLMQLVGDYRVVDFSVGEQHWMAGRTLAELRLRDEGIVVLGLRMPDGSYLGVPDGDSRVPAGVSLVIYGRRGSIKSLSQRTSATVAAIKHREGVREHEKVHEKEVRQVGEEVESPSPPGPET